jgi:hypothetical protein
LNHGLRHHRQRAGLTGEQGAEIVDHKACRRQQFAVDDHGPLDAERKHQPLRALVPAAKRIELLVIERLPVGERIDHGHRDARKQPEDTRNHPLGRSLGRHDNLSHVVPPSEVVGATHHHRRA